MTFAISSTPQEIYDLVIDELGHSNDKTEYRETLRACSLVSRAFHRRAQHHLLSEISFMKTQFEDEKALAARIRALKAILNSGMAIPCNATDKLVCRIRSLKLVVYNTAELEIYRILDKELATVIKLLNGPTHGLRDFYLMVYAPPFMELDWANVDPAFEEAFLKMLKSPLLTSLHLHNINCLPTSLLRGTHIRHIDFSSLQFVDTPPHGLLPHDKLEKIHIDSSIPLVRLLKPDASKAKGKPTFNSSLSHLRDLVYTVPITNDFQKCFQPIMAAFNNIENLKLDFLEMPAHEIGSMSWNIPYSELPVMKSLTISLQGSKFAKTPQALLSALVKMFYPNSCPKSLKKLQFELSIQSFHPWAKREQFFPKARNWLAFDYALNHKNFVSVVEVDLKMSYHIQGPMLYTFNEDFFRARCHAYIRETFPITASPSSTKKLNLSVTPYFWA